MSLHAKFAKILSIPEMYSGAMRMLGAGRGWQIYAQEYLMAKQSQKILDLGCGPADILDYLPEVHYTGIDSNPEYIKKASRKYGDRGHFLCASLDETIPEILDSAYDLVMMNSVLHHLDDGQAMESLQFARRVLKKDGKLVSIDPCRVPGQALITTFLMNNDRGSFIRNQPLYVKLCADIFPNVQTHIRQDLMVIPYTHLIMVCSL